LRASENKFDRRAEGEFTRRDVERLRRDYEQALEE